MKDCDKIINFEIDMDDIVDELEHEVGSTTDEDPDSPVKPPPPKKLRAKGSAASKLKTAQKRAEEIFASLKDCKEFGRLFAMM